MILGGSRYAVPVIEAAHKLGLYVISCDYIPNNIAHKYSDEYCNVSITDKEATLEAARELNIDGITSFACDPGVVTAAYIAEELNLPRIGSYESISIMQNKKRFRDFLAKNGFNVPTAKGYTNIDEALSDTSMFHWPVIVKPTDSAGSKGVTRADNPADLKSCIENALSYSRCKEFIIEDFIIQDGFSSDSDCFSVNGKLEFVSFNSQRFDPNAENPYTPAAYSWPSSMPNCIQKELAEELQRLINLLELNTSIYNVETRMGDDGRPYIMECSPRGGGNRLAECLEYATGVKLVENSVRAAMGMPIVDMAQVQHNGCWAEIILHSVKQGIFDGLWIAEEIEKNVVEQDLWVDKGAVIGGFNAANESIGTLVLKFNNDEQLQFVMSDIERFVKVKIK